jgi:transposase
MSIRLKENLRVFVFSEYVDLRAGFDKLSWLVRDKMQADLVNGDLFLFFGHNRKRLKAICYDGTGLLLLLSGWSGEDSWGLRT